MTIQQKAYNLIDDLPEDSVRIIVDLMSKMLKVQSIAIVEDQHQSVKMKAFEKMQNLRQESSDYEMGDYDKAREDAMKEKYGQFMK